MWISTSMTFGESLILSGMGILTVFSALVLLACCITIFSKVMENQGKKPAAAAAPAPAPVKLPDVSNETCAMIISVICEEMNAAPEEINITSIKKL